MKFAIFCCQLAFCAFEIVHADLGTDKIKTYTDAANEMSSYVTPIKKNMKDLFTKTEASGKDISDCRKTFELFEENETERKQELQNCLNAVRTPKDLANESTCAAGVVQRLKDVGDSTMDQTLGCVIITVNPQVKNWKPRSRQRVPLPPLLTLLVNKIEAVTKLKLEAIKVYYFKIYANANV